MSNIDKVKHYNNLNIECIEVAKHFNFCLGNAIKYIWRAGKKDKNKTIEDLKKAVWYLEYEIKELEGKNND